MSFGSSGLRAPAHTNKSTELLFRLEARQMSPQAENNREVRKQRRLARIGSNHPFCPVCGWRDWRSFEEHHVAGKFYSALTMWLCVNCHRILSDMQKDHPDPISDSP